MTMMRLTNVLRHLGQHARPRVCSQRRRLLPQSRRQPAQPAARAASPAQPGVPAKALEGCEAALRNGKCNGSRTGVCAP